MTTYQDILDGLHERFATIPALGANRILPYEPTSADDNPKLYSMFADWRLERQGQVDKHIYRVLHRVVTSLQDNEGVELLLMPFLEWIPAAIHTDPRLGDRLNEGYAECVEATGVYVIIGGVTCRAYDFTSESHYKVGRG